MLEYINFIVNSFNELSQKNQFVAGAISLWGLGVLTWLSRNIPQKVWNFIVKQSTVELTINNDNDFFYWFFQWYHDTKREEKSRTLMVKSYNMWEQKNSQFNEVEVSAGYGSHYFFFKGRIFKLLRTEKEQQTTDLEVKEHLELVTIGRSKKQFRSLIKEVHEHKLRQIQKNKLIIKHYSEYWERTGEQPSRALNTVVIPTDDRNKLIKYLNDFFADKEWHINNGIPYRTGILLYGPPGTGKTSLVKGLCDEFKKDLHILKLATMSDNSLDRSLISLEANSFVLIEDIDTYRVSTHRGKYNGDNNTIGLTLSGLLNSIDGISGSNGRVIFATTNAMDNLEPALIRKGRFDIHLKMSYLTTETIYEFFERLYPDFEMKNDYVFKKDITPATFQYWALEHKNEPKKVLKNCLEMK